MGNKLKKHYCIRLIRFIASFIILLSTPLFAVSAESILPPTPIYPVQGCQDASLAPSFIWAAPTAGYAPVSLLVMTSSSALILTLVALS